ncbi:MAG: HPF/RaiA family ribosome-associated protein [Gemmatimonadota bacterium]
MLIQVNTDHNIEGREELVARVEAVVEAAMSRFGDRITRVEVHINDENGAKISGNDKRCMMEARLEHRRPTSVTNHAASVDAAVSGAADKLQRALESTLGRLGA